MNLRSLCQAAWCWRSQPEYGRPTWPLSPAHHLSPSPSQKGWCLVMKNRRVKHRQNTKESNYSWLFYPFGNLILPSFKHRRIRAVLKRAGISLVEFNNVDFCDSLMSQYRNLFQSSVDFETPGLARFSLCWGYLFQLLELPYVWSKCNQTNLPHRQAGCHWDSLFETYSKKYFRHPIDFRSPKAAANPGPPLQPPPL